MFGTTQVFRYTAPTFITSDTFVPASELDTCANQDALSLPCFGIDFLPSGPDTPEHYPELVFQTLNPDSSVGSVFYYFALGSSFAAPGTLTNVPDLGNAGVLTITETTPVAIPEPATGSTLFLAGVALLLWRRRSRNLRASTGSTASG
jgi:hypothetical protein